MENRKRKKMMVNRKRLQEGSLKVGLQLIKQGKRKKLKDKSTFKVKYSRNTKLKKKIKHNPQL